MGGRGRGGGGGSANTVRSVANALGIARYDVQRMMSQQKIEPPPLYPRVQRDPMPLEMSTDMVYVSRLKMELDQRMRDSAFFIEEKKEEDVKRYLDKYWIVKRDKLDFDMTRLPAELDWRRKKGEKRTKTPDAKRRKMANDDSFIKDKLKKLEEKEGAGNEDDEEKGDEANETGSEKSGAEDAEQVLSDDDYQEEDNDYITSYFDNGEGYGDGGSDDNIDGDDY